VSYGLPAEAAPPAPTCAWHADRETWIRCARCNRPICPECMTAAAVGYQCPDCLRQGAATVRQPRTVFGGRVGRDGVVTMSIIGVCVGLYLLVGVLDLAGGLARWGMQPFAIAVGEEWFRLVSAIFLHAGLLHLGFNMYVLYLLGPSLERLLGHARFLTLFLLSGLGGSVASYAFSPIRTLSVGASGAIFGLMAAWIVVSRRLNADASQVLVLLAINVALGFFLPGVDWRAHLGGAATGAVVALALTHGHRQPGSVRVGPQVLGVAAVVLVLIALTLWRTEAIRALIPV
jgi:membrane associated rhomboid family serine protease